MFNPVQQAALDLANEYAAFPMIEEARLLLWVTDKDTQEMVQAMLTTHTEQTALLTDMTLPANVPFEKADRYQFEVAKKLVDDIRASQEDEDMDAEFRKWDSGVHLQRDEPLISLLEDLGERIQAVARHVTLYFHPSLINDHSEFMAWIVQIVEKTSSPFVQYLIFDIYDQDYTGFLQPKLDTALRVTNKRIDMNKVINDTLDDEQKAMPDGPEKSFQKHIVSSVTALRKGNSQEAHKQAQAAYVIADKHNWKDMKMTATLVFGNAILGQGYYSDAARFAKNAIEIGKDSDELGIQPVIKNLMLQAYFLEANSYLMQEKWSDALSAYEAAIAQAALVGNKLLEFEARRMSVFCARKTREDERGWEAGEEALTIAEDFPNDLKRDGTLPNLAADLKKIAEKEDERWDIFTQKMQHLYAQDWKNYC